MKPATTWSGELQKRIDELERENARLNRLIDTILTDPNYEGGVQYWVQKHDALSLQYLRLVTQLRQDRAARVGCRTPSGARVRLLTEERRESSR